MEPSITEIIYYVFLGLLTSIGQVFLVILCLYYLYKIGTKADSVLLIVGSLISLLCAISNPVGALYAKSWGADSYLSFTYIIQGFSALASLLFVIGFFLLIRRVIKNIAQTQH